MQNLLIFDLCFGFFFYPSVLSAAKYRVRCKYCDSYWLAYLVGARRWQWFKGNHDSQERKCCTYQVTCTIRLFRLVRLHY
jgi:hypothetical protein